MPISNQKETIDIRILRLIGIEDVFDLDYETYATLLKEAMIKGRMAKTAIPTEETMLLTEEYKRIKAKKGRFEVKKDNKITSKSFNVGNIKAKISGPTKALPGTTIGASPLAKSLENNISIISTSFTSILDTLRKQKKVDAAEDEYDRRKAEREKRSLTESKLEKRFSGLKKTAEKIIAPVKSLLDRILEFFTTVILGRIVYKLVDWMGNPENANKVKSIIRFLGDWWPALLGSYILFGTTFGKFIRGTIGMLGRFIFQIGKVAIPQLLRFIKSPLGIGAGLFAAGAMVPAMFPGTVNEQERKTSSAPGTNEDKIRALLQQKANLNLIEKLQGKGSEIDEQISFLKTGQTKSYGFNGGGFVNGFVSGEKGVDKVPAMLSDGEFVMSRGAVEKYGVDTLEAMNASGGGTNRPRIVKGVSYAAGGGMIGNSVSNTPFMEDPLSAVLRFLKHKFGVDISNRSTWGMSPQVLPSRNKAISTGSIITDPVGAISRIANNVGIPVVKSFAPKKKTSGKNMFQEIGQKMQGSGSATYRDAGSTYLRQMLGGFGGPISEMDLSGQSKIELQKAIERAKKRTNIEIAKTEAKIKELRSMGATDGNPALEVQKSFLKKLRQGGIRVQYTDYADKGKLSDSAQNAKNIIGQFWAYERSKKEGGGYRIEDKYDFDRMKDPRKVLFGKDSSVQQRLQALHQMNPFKGRGDVDMVLGGKRSLGESLGLSSSKTLLGSMFGISGNRKTEAQRRQEFLDKNPGTKLYDKPQSNTPYRSRFARPKNAGVKPVKPPRKTSVTSVSSSSPAGGGMNGGRSSRLSRPKTPSFSATTRGSGAKAKTLGITR